MKRLSLLFCALIFSVSAMMAQRTVTGVVADTDGEPLIGANILAQGTASGTITDIDGSFELSVPDGSNVLIISFTGYETQEFDITGQTNINVVLQEGELLNEVVVTGLGIKKEKKALGFGVSTISTEEVANRAEADVARILRGKATGVDITQTSGLAGSGTNIIIRGYSSITGSNQPLFVVDGVPFNTDTNNDRAANQGGAATSSRFLDLDPNNIAEISILKGLSATVLYGEAGRNGVILVTTKNGSVGGRNDDKGFEVSFSQSIAQTEVANLPNYQNEFGNGFSGNFGWFFSNWGPSFSVRGSNGVDENGQIDHPYDQGQYNDDFPEFIGADYEYRSYQPTEGFFGKGLSTNTSFSVSKNFDGGGVSATYSYLDDEGFLRRKGEMQRQGNGTYQYVENGDPSNALGKHNFGLGATAQLANGLTVKGTFNFVTSKRVAPPTAFSFGSGSGGNSSVFGDIFYTARSINLNGLPFQSPIDGSNVYYRRGAPIVNPYWTLNNQQDFEDVDRFTSTIDLNYAVTDDLNIQYRVGVDQYTQQQRRTLNKGGGNQSPGGSLLTSNRLNTITDHVLNLTYNKNLTEDLDFDILVGVNGRREKRDQTFASSQDQFVFGLFTHNNFIEHNNFSFNRDENTIGAYASATFGYKSFLYVTAMGRNDWTSTLEPENRSNFYPSLSVSFVPTDALEGLQNNKVLNYLKLRASYGTSAGYPDPYQTQNVLDANTNQFVTPAGATLNTNGVSNRLGNPNLQAERISEIEFGIESRLLDNRVGIDLSVYNKNSSDLIIDLNLDPATGATRTTVNAAEVSNKGIELGLNFVPVRGDFTWDFTLNYTRNRNVVESIFDGVDQILIGGGFTNLGNFAVPGEQYGVIKGLPFQRNDAGELLVGADGNYVPGQDIETIGNPNPNFQANWINQFSYKGLSLGFQFSYIDGGDIYSVTTATMLARGLTEDTNVDRFLPIIQPGVLASDGSTPNNIQGYIGDYFFRSYFFADEGTIFDGTVVRLREVSLSYQLPSSLLDKTPFGRASLVLVGENLWYSAPNFPEHVNFDPEVLSTGVGNGRGFDFITGPTTKKYGVTLNMTF